jgi:hypothetical protein
MNIMAHEVSSRRRCIKKILKSMLGLTDDGFDHRMTYDTYFSYGFNALIFACRVDPKDEIRPSRTYKYSSYTIIKRHLISMLQIKPVTFESWMTFLHNFRSGVEELCSMYGDVEEVPDEK